MLRRILLLLLSITHICEPQPQVVINSTTVNGRSIRILGALTLEFFGGISLADLSHYTRLITLTGIQYADAARFSPPVPHLLTSSSLDATQYGPPCPQTVTTHILLSCD